MARSKARLEHLRAVPLFRTLNAKELALVDKLGYESPQPAGEVLVKQGASGREFYIVTNGKAEVTRDGHVVGVLGPGDHFGELALLDPQPRLATVTMTSDGSVMELPQREFWQLLTDVPSISLKVLQALARMMHAERSV
jgi:CRP/FNR family transcriptional regulator